MKRLNVQERYDDICNKAGMSEIVVRQVLKAARESLVESLREGSIATLPGICTIIPEIMSKPDRDNVEQTFNFIKLKAKASEAMTTELEKSESFIQKESSDIVEASNLRYIGRQESDNGIVTKQISALL